MGKRTLTMQKKKDATHYKKKPDRLTKTHRRSIIRRNKTAWIYFCNRNRQRITQEEPSLKFGSICRRLAKEWHSLPQTEKQEYHILAKEDKVRYEQSFSTLTDQQKNFLKRYKKAKRIARKQHPKLSLSPYMFFVVKKRASVLATAPKGIPFVDIGRLLGRTWREMAPEEKDVYIKLSQDDRVRYHTEMETYKKEKKQTGKHASVTEKKSLKL